ncbi:hypothetical protein [Methylorubrum extorquens]|uniref:Uncharacterized protein n=1 Tax=Methylorubrum extorquens (strain ATCC 14718 / DSM 1338 / JCM 2805 / NCIMB 9133 / AM1) TaxID=272630 RepID=C5B594_METEA|nr:hypothetical protein [Methylorubrum extorquens]ACS43626.1 Hypothetical protein MexAM1_META2p0786 [Methylorubrum extorquens AM1]MCP1546570.1 hypothetical protein [Methylorubrum extorquens]MCP1591237.1 hypothetical protein [Methylorubrum extorquens]
MRRLALVLAACIGTTAAAAGPLPSYDVWSRAPLDVPPAYLDRGAVGPDLHPGAEYYSTGCQFVRRELLDERGEIRVFRVPACL